MCCVAPGFTASADFAIAKPAGRPCPNLRPDSRCGIHADLREQGFGGCAAFDCFGAGQQVTQVTFVGRDWRSDPGTATAMFAAFAIQRQLHELLWYLTEALSLPQAAGLRPELTAARDRVVDLTRAAAGQLARLDTGALLQEAGGLLARVSELVRGGVGGRAPDRRRADLAGADLTGAQLRGASLRGACLIGARLRGADLRQTDLLGADLRGADLCGADLTGSLFVTGPQLAWAHGDAATMIPAAVARPPHWAAASTI